MARRTRRPGRFSRDYQRPKTRVIRAPHGGARGGAKSWRSPTRPAPICARSTRTIASSPSYFEKAVPDSRCRPVDRVRVVLAPDVRRRGMGVEARAMRSADASLGGYGPHGGARAARGGRGRRRIRHRDAGAGRRGLGPLADARRARVSRRDSPRGAVQLSAARRLDEHRSPGTAPATCLWRAIASPSTAPPTGHTSLDVLLHQDAETATLLRRNDEIERYITSELEPAVALRREELASLRSRLAAQNWPRETSPAPTASASWRRP